MCVSQAEYGSNPLDLLRDPDAPAIFFYPLNIIHNIDPLAFTVNVFGRQLRGAPVGWLTLHRLHCIKIKTVVWRELISNRSRQLWQMLRCKPLFFLCQETTSGLLFCFARNLAVPSTVPIFYFLSTNFAKTKTLNCWTQQCSNPSTRYSLLAATILTAAMCHVASKARPLLISPVSPCGHVTRQPEDLLFWCHLVPRVQRWSSFSWLSFADAKLEDGRLCVWQ